MTTVLIILEGPDCAGKSTLASEIEYLLKTRDPGSTVELLHRGPPTLHPLDEYVTPLLEYRPGTGRHIICDRWHLGEVVYPRVIGRKTELTRGVLNYIQLFLESRGALTMIVNPGVDVIMSRYRTRGDRMLTDDQVRAATVEFMMHHVTKHGLVTARVNADDIIALARGAENRALPPHNFITYVGNPWPRVLLAGDIRACGGGSDCDHEPRHSPSGTAFMPYHATSGEFLMRALGDEPPQHLGLINACDVDEINGAWWLLGAPAMIALGRNAHLRVQGLGIPHAVVPHPQFVRRFHHAAATEYGELIRQIIGTERNELGWRP